MVFVHAAPSAGFLALALKHAKNARLELLLAVKVNLNVTIANLDTFHLKLVLRLVVPVMLVNLPIQRRAQAVCCVLPDLPHRLDHLCALHVVSGPMPHLMVHPNAYPVIPAATPPPSAHPSASPALAAKKPEQPILSPAKTVQQANSPLNLLALVAPSPALTAPLAHTRPPMACLHASHALLVHIHAMKTAQQNASHAIEATFPPSAPANALHAPQASSRHSQALPAVMCLAQPVKLLHKALGLAKTALQVPITQPSALLRASMRPLATLSPPKAKIQPHRAHQELFLQFLDEINAPFALQARLLMDLAFPFAILVHRVLFRLPTLELALHAPLARISLDQVNPNASAVILAVIKAVKGNPNAIHALPARSVPRLKPLCALHAVQEPFLQVDPPCASFAPRDRPHQAQIPPFARHATSAPLHPPTDRLLANFAQKAPMQEVHNRLNAQIAPMERLLVPQGRKLAILARLVPLAPALARRSVMLALQDHIPINLRPQHAHHARLAVLRLVQAHKLIAQHAPLADTLLRLALLSVFSVSLVSSHKRLEAVLVLLAALASINPILGLALATIVLQGFTPPKQAKLNASHVLLGVSRLLTGKTNATIALPAFSTPIKAKTLAKNVLQALNPLWVVLLNALNAQQENHERVAQALVLIALLVDMRLWMVKNNAHHVQLVSLRI
jgi:hypothetical protein